MELVLQPTFEKCGFNKEYESIDKYQGKDKEVAKYLFVM